MTRLMARDMCHPRQRWRVSVDRDSPRRHEEKQHSDMRNRIRARQASDAKCARVAPRHFPRAIKTGKRGKIVSRERERERREREGGKGGRERGGERKGRKEREDCRLCKDAKACITRGYAHSGDCLHCSPTVNPFFRATPQRLLFPNSETEPSPRPSYDAWQHLCVIPGKHVPRKLTYTAGARINETIINTWIDLENQLDDKYLLDGGNEGLKREKPASRVRCAVVRQL